MDIAQGLNGTSTEIPFAFMLYNYEQFKENALSDGLLKYDNGQFFEVPYIPVRPYEQRTAFMATPMYIRSENKEVVFTFPSSLFFTNYANNAVASIEMDFGSGYEFVTLGGSKRLTWSNGQKEIKIRCTLSNQQILESHAVFYVENPQRTSSFRLYSSTPDKVIQIPAKNGEHFGLHADIFFACPTNQKLYKPLLVIDGIDFPQLPNRDFHALLSRLNIGYPDVKTGTPLLDLLQEEGYDIIFLDYNNGSDFLERNALAVEDALVAINALKKADGSSEQNVMIGASQGGVVGKYALLEMQQKNIDAEMKTYMNLDGPMRGANLPLGIQYLLKQIVELEVFDITPVSNFVPTLTTAKMILNEPSVQQLLYYQAFSSGKKKPTGVDLINGDERMMKQKCLLQHLLEWAFLFVGYHCLMSIFHRFLFRIISCWFYLRNKKQQRKNQCEKDRNQTKGI